MAGFKFGCASGSGYVTCDMDCKLEIASPILLGTNDYSGAGGGTGPVYAKRSAILDYSVKNVDVLMGAFIIDTSQQVPTFYDIYNWTSGYNKLLGKDGIQTGNYHGYFGYVSSGNLKNAYNDANIPIFTDPDEFFAYLNPVATYASNGGGATHIAKRTGHLKDLSSYTSDILLVSGGGGGGLLVGENAYNGADAGGISGSGNNSGNQSSGYAFGQGESGTNESGGGSGLYGGTKNGTSSTIIMNSWCKTTDYNNHRQSSHRHNFTVNFNTDVVSELSSYLGSDYILEYLGDNPSGGMYSQVPITYDGDNNVFYSSVYNKHIALPIKSDIGKIVKLAFTYTNKSSGSYAWIQVGLLKINGNTTTTLKYAQYSSTGNYELTLDTPAEADYLWICNAEDLFEISNMTMYVQASIMNEAGAGSGYIGNSLLSNKKMVGYNVPTSDAEGTKTESINDVSASAVANKPKSGNGHARIKYLTDGIIRFKNAIVFPHNDFTVIGKNQVEYTIAQVSQMCAGKNNNTYYLQWSGTRYICLMFNEASGWDMKLASDVYAKGEGQEDWLYGMNGASPLYPCELNGNYLGVSWSFNSVFIDNTYYIDYGDRGGTEEHPIIIVSNLANFDVYKDGAKVMVR